MKLTKGIYLTLYIFSVIGLWQFSAFSVPNNAIPSPIDVLILLFNEPLLFAANAFITFSEALTGFLLGVMVAFIFSLGIIYFKHFSTAFWPLIVFIRIVPRFVLIPLLLVWVGYGMGSIVILVALISFLPIMNNAIYGLRSVDSALLDVMKSYGATKWQLFRKILVPSAFPFIMVGFRTSLNLSMTAAIISEIIISAGGLGFLVKSGQENSDITLIFASILTLFLAALALNMLFKLVSNKLVYWKNENIRNASVITKLESF